MYVLHLAIKSKRGMAGRKHVSVLYGNSYIIGITHSTRQRRRSRLYPGQLNLIKSSDEITLFTGGFDHYTGVSLATFSDGAALL